jgi:hypothetical protein
MTKSEDVAIVPNVTRNRSTTARLQPIQQRVVQVLEGDPNTCIDTLTLAALVYEVAPADDGLCHVSRAQISAVDRALRRLMEQGKVDALGFNSQGRRRWSVGTGKVLGLSYRQISLLTGVSKSTTARDLQGTRADKARQQGGGQS